MKTPIFFPVIVLISLFTTIGCARIPAKPPTDKNAPPPYSVAGQIYYPLCNASGYIEKGIASWYGEKFHGRKTSNGEIYNMYAKTAAHRILPFGTSVQVTNLTNSKKTTLRINDRGPFVKNRIIDLSYAGALEIGLIGPGTAPVEIKVLTLAKKQNQDAPTQGTSNSTMSYWTGNFTIQIGAFKDLNNATRLKEMVSNYVNPVYLTTFNTEGRTVYKVRAGKFHTLKETIAAQKKLQSKGYYDTFVVAE
ncbi:MAG: septal ring lytic transglycosylase RlpA family protein [Proteobacteria bacterium]|nr:septal ring lytic transglycosylase RlpA family protein [Pseudomonadota bacterium]